MEKEKDKLLKTNYRAFSTKGNDWYNSIDVNNPESKSFCFMMDFAITVETLMKEKGLDKEGLSKLVGYSVCDVYKILRGELSLSVLDMYTILDKLGSCANIILVKNFKNFSHT